MTASLHAKKGENRAEDILVVRGDVGWVLVGEGGSLVDVELCQQDGRDMLRGHGYETGAAC